MSRDFPLQHATRLSDWSAGGLLRCIVPPVCPCVVSFSKFHEPDTLDMSLSSSRGCHEDATRKLVPWNSGLTQRSRSLTLSGGVDGRTEERLAGVGAAGDHHELIASSRAELMNGQRQKVDRTGADCPPLARRTVHRTIPAHQTASTRTMRSSRIDMQTHASPTP